MRTTLAPLIRLRRFRLDEERRALAAACAALQALEQQLAALDATARAEQQEAAADPAVAGATFGAYAAACVARRHALSASLASCEAEVSQQRERVLAAWRDLRTLELAEEARQRQLVSEQQRRETAALDEIGGTVWRRALTSGSGTS